MPIFRGIREDILQLLLELSPTVQMNPGGVFFHEGDKANSLYVLESGKVAVLKTVDEGEILLQELEQGACFGEMAAARSTSAQCDGARSRCV
jgi:CRP-like cAMP-binding protein